MPQSDLSVFSAFAAFAVWRLFGVAACSNGVRRLEACPKRTGQIRDQTQSEQTCGRLPCEPFGTPTGKVRGRRGKVIGSRAGPRTVAYTVFFSAAVARRRCCASRRREGAAVVARSSRCTTDPSNGVITRC